ncbi:MAG: CapA family protein [Ruminococcaceae bacterium]|nr:CapA family protein [Oscillospiraceae bacterium]
MNAPRKKRRRQLRPAVVAVIMMIVMALMFSSILIFTRCEEERPVDTSKKEEDLQISDPPPSPPEEPDEPVEPEVTRLNFVAFGDNLIHSSIIEDGERLASEYSREEKYYFDPMYENFSDIVSSADIAFINQETPIAGPDFPKAGYPNFNTPDEMGDTLIRLGFDVINTATNHMLDCRGKGLMYHLNYWADKEDLGVIQIGSYKDKADYDNIRVYEKDGVKIAFLAYTYSTNGMTAGAGYEDIYIPIPSNEELAKKVKEAKEIADLVFVSMHWGDEDSFTPNATQRDQAQTLVDAGADLIIGTHPHVIQEMKWKENSEGHKTLIVYSLGNFISTMYYPWNMFGGYLSVDIVKDENGAYLENPLFNPTMCHYSLKRRELKMYTLEEYSEELYKMHGTTLKNGTYSYDKIIQKVKEYIAPEFLTDYFNNYGE